MSQILGFSMAAAVRRQLLWCTYSLTPWVVSCITRSGTAALCRHSKHRQAGTSRTLGLHGITFNVDIVLAD